MKNPLSLSLFVVGACCCVFVAEALPTENNGRFKRQATTDAAPSSSSSTDGSTPLATQSTPTTSSAAPSSSSSSEPSQTNNNNDFGLGAVAGIGGLTRGVGIGNFQFPTATQTKNDPLAPWGAFAGLNLGNGGRIGAGCQGLSCGVQLGHFVLGTPQLLGLGRNILNPQQRRDDSEKLRPDGKKLPDETQTLSETNFVNPNPGNPNNFAITPANPEDIRAIFRDAFRGFRETLASFFRAPVTHFIKKDRAFQIDNSTESVVGPVRSATPAASEPKTYRIQLTPPKPPSASGSDKSSERENELD